MSYGIEGLSLAACKIMQNNTQSYTGTNAEVLKQKLLCTVLGLYQMIFICWGPQRDT